MAHNLSQQPDHVGLVLSEVWVIGNLLVLSLMELATQRALDHDALTRK
jgi:hypothetical protein